MKLVLMVVVFIQVAVMASGHSSKPSELTNSNNNDIPPDHRFFLNEIFTKYGHNGVMSYEGFEHLLANLGLGRLEFEKEHSVALHRVNGSFQEVHDKLELHEHHHGQETQRERRSVAQAEGDDDDALNKLTQELHEDATLSVKPVPPPRRCLSPQDILVTFGLEPHHSVMISHIRFLHMCPVIVYELDQRSCYDMQDETQESVNDAPWLQASLSVGLISAVGLLGVLVLPLIQKSFYQHLLNFLVGLAVGTLCGDALLHLLPHSLASHGHSHDSATVLHAGAAFLTLISFYLLEKIIHHIKSSGEEADDKANDNPPAEWTAEGSNRQPELGIMLNESHGHSHIPKGETSISSVASMVIIGDGLHNLTDGLAIGAAFSGDMVAGWATALAVLCHELPHEIGDFAVLIKSGMSVRCVIYYNMISSVLSFIGMAFGVWVGKIGSATLWIYSITAGSFLYIALAGLIPEMNRYSQKSKSLLAIILPTAGMITGGIIMLLIALYEHDLHDLFS